MNPPSILPVAGCVFVAAVSAASAQIPAAPDSPAPVDTKEFGQPINDQMIFVHGLLDQLEGRTNGRTPDFRWSGEGWVGTDYDKFWAMLHLT